MGTAIPRHSTAKRPVRLIAVAVVIVLIAVGAVVATLLLRGSEDARPDGAAPAGAVAPVQGDPAAAVRNGSEESREPPAASSSDAAVAPTTASPAPATDEAGVETSAPDHAVRTGAPVTLAEGVIATVRTVTPVRTVSRSAGTRAGEGAVVRLDVRNDTGAPIDLSALTVTATTGDGVPAAPSPGGVAAPLAGPLPGGETRAGTYVFTLAPGAAPAALVLHAWLTGGPSVMTERPH